MAELPRQVHMAMWIRKGTEKPDAIEGRAPRFDADAPPQAKAWRDFILNVQDHSCRAPKCFMCNGEPVDSCKYGYPRRLGVTETELNTETSRYEYKCAEEEDRKLSPYIPLWSLAWGGIDECAVVHRAWLSFIYLQVRYKD